MCKPTPNPPETENLQKAAGRALDEYITLSARLNATAQKPSTLFMVAPDNKTENLLAHASESLASARVIASDFATSLNGSQRSTILGIAQNIMLGELAVNRALDNLDPQD